LALFQVIRELFYPPTVVGQATEIESAIIRQVEEAAALLEAGDIGRGEEISLALTAAHPENQAVIDLQLMLHLAIVRAKFPGPDYHAWLAWFHAKLQPKAYLEIGVEVGASLRLAQHPTKAVGIDPAMQIAHSQEAWVKLFKLTSDRFFAEHNVAHVFGEEYVDLAFIDGLHTFDQALKDFINIERLAKPDSIILFHDILPVIPISAERERVSTFWVGDTWKALKILSEQRPDLTIFTISTFPSGLGVVTNLNPNNDSLERNFDNIIEDASRIELEAYLPEFETRFRVTENDFDAVEQLLFKGNQ